MVAALLIVACGLLTQAEAQVLQFTTVAEGFDSRITDSREAVARTESEWSDLWRQHAGGAPPAHDFSQSTILGVFLGTRPTAGYRVRITAVRVEANRIVVDYAERTPPAGAFVAQVLTSPFLLVSIPTDSRPVEFRAVDPQP